MELGRTDEYRTIITTIGHRLSRNNPKYSFNEYDEERQKLLNLNLDPLLDYIPAFYSKGGRPAEHQAQIQFFWFFTVSACRKKRRAGIGFPRVCPESVHKVIIRAEWRQLFQRGKTLPSPATAPLWFPIPPLTAAIFPPAGKTAPTGTAAAAIILTRMPPVRGISRRFCPSVDINEGIDIPVFQQFIGREVVMCPGRKACRR